jgi:hypothetical protein
VFEYLFLVTAGTLTRVLLPSRVAVPCRGRGGPCHGRGEDFGAGEREHAGRGLRSGARHECIQVRTPTTLHSAVSLGPLLSWFQLLGDPSEGSRNCTMLSCRRRPLHPHEFFGLASIPLRNKPLCQFLLRTILRSYASGLPNFSVSVLGGIVGLFYSFFLLSESAFQRRLHQQAPWASPSYHPCVKQTFELEPSTPLSTFPIITPPHSFCT